MLDHNILTHNREIKHSHYSFQAAKNLDWSLMKGLMMLKYDPIGQALRKIYWMNQF